MDDYIEVKSKVKACCKNCLYFSSTNRIPHCANANVTDSKSKIIVSPSNQKCFWFWLDQNRFKR